MQFTTRKLVSPQDLNHHDNVFGGRLLSWIDEECYIYAVNELQTPLLVTKYMSHIDFISTAQKGDVIEIGIATVAIGTTSFTMSCELRNHATGQAIVKVDRVVFVSINDAGEAIPHVLAGQSPS